METYRYFLELAFKGTHYHGWQVQQNAHTVQAELEKALTILLGRETAVTGSGRTDTGVHATQQFAHFDSTQKLEKVDFVKKMNGILPSDIACFDLKRVDIEAHTRFDAIWRSYLYRVCLRKDPFETESAWLLYRKPDISLMNEASKLLLEHQDFQCFSKVHTEVNHFRCKIKTAGWEQNGPHLSFHITANRFLRGMVRAIVGTLIEVGYEKISVGDFQRILESKDRKSAKSSAPAKGLYLCQITYPDRLFI
jgi:tRNA pseudouridine38-40 synthase